MKPPDFGAYQHKLLLIVGVGMAVDGMLMFVVSLILPELPESWELDATKRGVLGGAIFLGMCAGAPLWGDVSDRVGRLTTMNLTLGLAFGFGLLCALANSFWMFFAVEIAFGTCMGGFIPVANTLLLECSPADASGHSIGIAMNLFSIGATTASVAAGYVLPAFGWSWLLVFAAAPLGLSLLAAPSLRLVESPTWLAAHGRVQDAGTALGQINAANGTVSNPGKAADAASVVPHNGGSEHASVASGESRAPPKPSLLSLLMSREGVQLAVSLGLLWGCMSFAYYGIVFLLPTWVDTRVPAEWTYPAISLTAVAEIPGNLLAGYCCDRFGRRASIGAFFSLAAALCLLSGLLSDAIDSGTADWRIELVVICCLKAMVTAPFTSLYILTPEAFPTHVRNFALGLSTVVTRVGGTVTPAVGQLLLERSTSSLPTFLVYTTSCLVGALAAAALPFETLGRDADAHMVGSAPVPRGLLL